MIRPVSVFLIILTISLVSPVARAQKINARPGDLIIAEYGEKKSAPIKIIETRSDLVFVKPSSDGFIPIPAEGIEFGEFFAIELHFNSEQGTSRFQLICNWEDGGQKVIVTQVDGSNRLFRSNLLKLDLAEGLARISEGGIEP